MDNKYLYYRELLLSGELIDVTRLIEDLHESLNSLNKDLHAIAEKFGF